MRDFKPPGKSAEGAQSGDEAGGMDPRQMQLLARRRVQRKSESDSEGGDAKGDKQGGDPELPPKAEERPPEMQEAIGCAREQVLNPDVTPASDPSKGGDKSSGDDKHKDGGPSSGDDKQQDAGQSTGAEGDKHADANKPADGDKSATKPDDVYGLETTIMMDAFIADARKVQADWSGLTPDKRAEAMGNATNTQLAAAKVPPVNLRLEPGMDPLTPASFDGTIWTVNLSKPAYADDQIDDEKGGELAGAMYHESRHAEQYHLAARALHAKGKSADEIVAELSIPANIATDATNQPLPEGTAEARAADVFMETNLPEGRAQQVKVYQALAAADDVYLKTQDEYNKMTSDPNSSQEQKDAVTKAANDAYAQEVAAYNDYQALPMENDALRVGNETQAQYEKK